MILMSVLLVLFSSVVRAQECPAPEQALAEGDAQVAQEQFKQAVDSYTCALNAEATAQAYLKRGNAYRRLKDYPIWRWPTTIAVGRTT